MASRSVTSAMNRRRPPQGHDSTSRSSSMPFPALQAHARDFVEQRLGALSNGRCRASGREILEDGPGSTAIATSGLAIATPPRATRQPRTRAQGPLPKARWDPSARGVAEARPPTPPPAPPSPRCRDSRAHGPCFNAPRAPDTNTPAPTDTRRPFTPVPMRLDATSTSTLPSGFRTWMRLLAARLLERRAAHAFAASAERSPAAFTREKPGSRHGTRAAG